MTHSSNIRETALDWLMRTNDPEFDRWEEFSAWLEADPANADAYHGVAQSEIALLSLVETAGKRAEARSTSFGGRRLAIAASFAAAVALATTVVLPRLTPADYATGPAQMATVALGGQDQLVMNGDTRLSLTGWDRRTVKLTQGQILLRLRDTGRGKVEVTSGDLELIDVGTVFEVTRDGPETRVIVSEGAVVADPGGAGLQIGAGQRLDTSDGASTLKAAPADASAVGSFAGGQLAYFDEPLQNVVADLRRSTGVDFSVDPANSGGRFSGTLSVSAVRRDPQSLGPLLGVSMERSARGWKLKGKV